jgi:hypothetical protein
MIRTAKSSGMEAKCFLISKPQLDLCQKQGRVRPVEDFYKTMNARPEIRNALLVRRMNYWLLRARARAPRGGFL